MDADMHILARGIAAHLGGFSVEVNDWMVRLRGPGGEELSVRRARQHPGRVVVHGCYPDIDAALGMPAHEITAAASRGPAAIAADITRRLLPGYRASLTQVHDRIARRDWDDTQRAHVAARLAAAIPGATIAAAIGAAARTHHAGGGQP